MYKIYSKLKASLVYSLNMSVNVNIKEETFQALLLFDINMFMPLKIFVMIIYKYSQIFYHKLALVNDINNRTNTFS